MNGVEIISTEVIYNTLLPWWCSLTSATLTLTFLILALSPFKGEIYIDKQSACSDF